MIPDSFIQDLLNRVDIVNVIDKSVPLKKAGANYSACCPFHTEKSPSFTVSPTKQFYHCFGCGAHGSAIGFLMEYTGLSFIEAVSDLAKSVGLEVQLEQSSPASREADAATKTIKMSLQDSLHLAASFYKTELKNSPRAIEYLKSRGLSGVIAAKFQIGYAPAGWQNLQSVFANYENEFLQTAGLVVTNEQGKRYDRFRDRIMFPIHDQKGQVIGFGGRVINNEDIPKYYNSPETPLFQKGHELYGLFVARRAIRDAGRALVVEGYMDVVALAQFGIEYAVAALGTATTPYHIAKLMRQTDEIVFCFDGDKAGQTAAWRAAMNALPTLTDGLKLRFLFLPVEHDPDSYVREFGKEKFELDIKAAMPLSLYIVQHLTLTNPLQSQEDKVSFLNDAEPILRQIKAPRFSLMLRKKIAELANVTDEEMQSLLKLPAITRPNVKSTQRQSRAPVSIIKRFVLMLLMQPGLVKPEHLDYALGSDDENALLRHSIHAALEQPSSKPATLLHTIEAQVAPQMLREIERELQLLDENINIQLEFEGARTQLQELRKQNHSDSVLSSLKEKPLSALTIQEREMLANITIRKN